MKEMIVLVLGFVLVNNYALSAFFGLTTKYAECLLAFKYREKNAKGEMAGGPMYTMKNGIANKSLGRVMGFLFALPSMTGRLFLCRVA